MSEAYRPGLLDRAVAPEDLDAAVREAIAAGIPKDRTRPPLSPKHAALEAFFEARDPEALRTGKADASGNDDLGKAMKRVASKAPIALGGPSS